MNPYLTIKTNDQDTEIALLSADASVIDSKTWQPGRELSKVLLTELQTLLAKNNTKFAACAGIIVLQGPGSFTGLRIGLTVANTIAYSEGLPIVATQGESWQKIGIQKLQKGENDKIAMPFYGADANITKPRK